MRKIKGFTLIEIVVVIVLIGILSAVALPRFYDFTGKASEAAAKGMSGALASSVSMAHSAYLAEGSKGSAFSSATGNTYGFDVNSKGYPVPAAYTDEGCTALLASLLSESSNTSEYIAYTSTSAGPLTAALGGNVVAGKTCIYVHNTSGNQGAVTGEGGPYSFYTVVYNSERGIVKQVTTSISFEEAATPPTETVEPISGG